ncbi:MAG: choice-of-anchor I family protein, partial [Pseudomonadota bacterium]
VLVANEGEPNDAYTLDPEGSITIINMQAGAAEVSINDVRTVRFSGLAVADLPPDLRIAKPDATPANDLEPEYIAVAPGGTTAYVTLQENNAVAILDIPSATLKRIVPLGFKSFQIDPIDASDKDGKINIRTWPVFGMYQPDAIAAFEDEGTLYFAIANEGDSRDYEAFSEEARVGELTLDPAAFPEAEELQLDRNLGRLKVATTLGDVDNDGDYDALYAFGGRSFSIWDADSDEMVFDSASQFERFLAVLSPDTFNSTNESNKSFDDRSDDKGPEPEGIVIGVVNDKRYAFIGLERIGGVMVYDISNPREPELTTYFNRRNFDGEPESFTADDLGPEGLAFVPADQSPTGEALLIVGNEISGTTSIFAVRAGEE